MLLAEAQKRLQEILEEIADAAKQSGRSVFDIKLLAVSKTFPAESVELYLKAGQLDFGESYIQEAREKIPLLAGRLPEIRPNWHLIGHLQSNKAKYAAKLFDLIHSLDSFELAQELDKQLTKNQRTIEAYLELNVSGEKSKNGLTPQELPDFLDKLSALESIKVKGLMTMPPYDQDPELSRPYFSALRELRDKYLPQGGLSMGMSGDFKVAISEGATIVRVGTALFGERDYL